MSMLAQRQAIQVAETWSLAHDGGIDRRRRMCYSDCGERDSRARGHIRLANRRAVCSVAFPKHNMTQRGFALREG
jgi:hypothetical protein